MQALNLRHYTFNKALAAEAGVNGHQQYHINVRQNFFYRTQAGSGVQCNAGLHALSLNLLDAAVQMFGGFYMHNNLVGTGSLESGNVFFRIFYHQMAVEKQVGYLTDFFHYRSTEGQVRYKLAVHNIDVYPVGTGSFNFFDFVRQICKIGR